MKKILTMALALLALAGCGGEKKKEAREEALNEAPAFVADSAMACIRRQCGFGARVPGSEAHRLCGDYIAAEFRRHGLAVAEQQATLTAWNGDRLPMRNIVASLHPEAEMRLLVSAHWDSRPWADNDPDPANHRTPVLAANDGASGVAVMIEMARVLAAFRGGDGIAAGKWGVDFVCFDCEDYGVAQWSGEQPSDNTWALGSQHWAVQPHKIPYRALWGANLDMVGGRGARFMHEGISMHFAPHIVRRAWRLAERLGLEAYFPQEDGGVITDDHLPVNQHLGIPTIDIIACYPDCEESNFGPTWHTVADTPDNIDPATIQAVGTLMTTFVCNPL